MSNDDAMWKKLTCKCGEYFRAKYTNEEIRLKYPKASPFKWIKLKRQLKCPECGTEKKISRRLLFKISTLSYKNQTKGDE